MSEGLFRTNPVSPYKPYVALQFSTAVCLEVGRRLRNSAALKESIEFDDYVIAGIGNGTLNIDQWQLQVPLDVRSQVVALVEAPNWDELPQGEMVERPSKPTSKDFLMAEKYLRRNRRFMNYWEQRERLCPIGSGIVESACKQIVSERMKLSGMRWKYEGMQQIMTLRSNLLSQTWASTFKQVLLSNSPVENQCASAA